MGVHVPRTAEEWRQRAEELRVSASHVGESSAKHIVLLQLAKSCETIADSIDHVDRARRFGDA